MGRGLIVLLILSLAVNVFAVGFISGRVISGGNQPPPPQIQTGGANLQGPMRLMRFAETLPSDLRVAFREKIRAQLPVVREEQRDVRRLRGELANQIAEDEWDRAAVEAIAIEIAEAETRQRAALYTAFIDAFETLPAEERKRFIELEKRRRLDRLRRLGRPPPPGE